QARLDGVGLPFLGDHLIHGQPLLPLAAYLEMAGAGGACALGARPPGVRELVTQRPLAVGPDRPVVVQTVLEPGDNGQWALRVASATPASTGDASWTTHVTA